MSYEPAADRYENARFRRCGRTGLKLPAISLGMWHNFGSAPGAGDEDNARRMCYRAFDLGITHFDLANNYGPPPGSAETLTGKILKDMPRRELVISSKAGFYMWPGPYGEWGSRKYLLSSLDESLKRLGLDYVDIFYHHRPDPNTPLEETLGALDHAVRSGKAIYAGISNYNGPLTRHALSVARGNHYAPIIVNQSNYHMLNRGVEEHLAPVAGEEGIGIVAFCPLAQGMLTEKYLAGIPEDSRAASKTGFLRPAALTDEVLGKVRKLADHAKQRGQSLAQMALAWVLRDPRITTALIGASRVSQIEQNVAALENAAFSADELARIDAILAG